MGLGNWLEERSGLPGFVRDRLNEPVSRAGRWRRAVGAGVLFLFALQILTGMLLMAVYSPSTTTAWGSVWYVQTQMAAGWLIRGLHRFAGDAMILLLGVYVLQFIFAAAYRRPRELQWWVVLGMLAVTAALGHTGYLLPWDQQAYWAAEVRTNILAMTPFIGDDLRTLLLGGTDLGQATLTRFYALHVVALPVCFLLLAVGHQALARRFRRAEPENVAGLDAARFWPDQFLRNSLIFVAVLVAVFAVVCYSHAVRGNNWLGAPADPAGADYPARPEWYARFLFQWLKAFDSPTGEMIGAIIVPGLMLLVALVVPFFDRVMSTRAAHRTVVGLAVTALVAFVGLTYASLRDDRDPPEERVSAVHARQDQGETLTESEQRVLRAWRFNRQKEQAAGDARRSFELAAEKGIPPEGPLALLANDPWTRGPRLFAAHCAACHRFDGHNGLGWTPPEPASSSDLAGFATREWIRGLLAEPLHDRYFGLMVRDDGSPAHTRMAKWTDEMRQDSATDEALAGLHADFDAAAAYLEDESLHPGRLASLAAEELEKPDEGLSASELQLRRGRAFFLTECNACHSYQGERHGTFNAPEMYGYGSVAWLEKMIAHPSHETLYRDRGKGRAMMPSFEDRLSENERRLLTEWLHVSRGLRNATSTK